MHSITLGNGATIVPWTHNICLPLRLVMEDCSLSLSVLIFGESLENRALLFGSIYAGFTIYLGFNNVVHELRYYMSSYINSSFEDLSVTFDY